MIDRMTLPDIVYPFPRSVVAGSKAFKRPIEKTTDGMQVVREI